MNKQLVMYYNEAREHVVLETYFPDTLIRALGKIGFEAHVTPF